VLKSQLYYTEGDKSAYLLVLLDTLEIPKLEKAVGPNVSDIINSQKFIENNKAIFGPFVTGDRWVAIRNRRYTDIGHISDEIIKANFDLSASVYVEEDIMNAYTKNIEIIKYFADFFYPKEKFL
jgi:tRNA nucleotidyltransferase (CCA-adding enzyme)